MGLADPLMKGQGEEQVHEPSLNVDAYGASNQPQFHVTKQKHM